MNYSWLGHFSQKEKAALLKLMIQIAYSDGQWSEEEKSAIKEYSMQNDVKCNGKFIQTAMAEHLDGILAEFDTCKNLQRGKRLSLAFAKKHGIAPDFERTLLRAVEDAGRNKKKEDHAQHSDMHSNVTGGVWQTVGQGRNPFRHKTPLPVEWKTASQRSAFRGASADFPVCRGEGRVPAHRRAKMSRVRRLQNKGPHPPAPAGLGGRLLFDPFLLYKCRPSTSVA